jgi:hypothetical protein
MSKGTGIGDQRNDSQMAWRDGVFQLVGQLAAVVQLARFADTCAAITMPAT